MAKIIFFEEDIKANIISRKNLRSWILELIDIECKEAGDLNIIFCSDSYLLEMNKKFLKHNYLTDIITFSNVKENLIQGELFISIDRVKDNAKRLNVSLSEEIQRVIFHGILHLIGYKDKSKNEKREMRRKENFYLNKFVRNEL